MASVTSDGVVLELAGVAKTYGATQVLRPTDLTVRDGEFLTLLGPSGSGKTTILRLIAGLTASSAGQILFEGADLTRVLAFRRPFNTVFQDYALFPHMTVRDNVGYGLRIRQQGGAATAEAVDEALAVVGLEHKGSSHPADLSGGQRQRVALARAIICRPRILLLDEPLAALDAELRRSMRIFLKTLQQKIQTTFVFVTHDQEEAIAISDRIVVMSAGGVEQVGSPRDIYEAPRSAFVARFFGENNLLPALLASDALGRPVVRSPLGEHRLAIPAAISAVSRLLLALRPEHIRVGPRGLAQPGCANLADARIEQITYLGPYTEVAVSVGGDAGETIRARIPAAMLASGLAEGQDVQLAWPDAAVSLVVG